MCCSLLLLKNGAGLSPSAGTPLEKRSAGSHRAAISWITLAEGSARGAPWASSALTASEVGGICDTSVVARLSPTRSRSSTAARCTHGFSSSKGGAARPPEQQIVGIRRREKSCLTRAAAAARRGGSATNPAVSGTAPTHSSGRRRWSAAAATPSGSTASRAQQPRCRHR